MDNQRFIDIALQGCDRLNEFTNLSYKNNNNDFELFPELTVNEKRIYYYPICLI